MSDVDEVVELGLFAETCAADRAPVHAAVGSNLYVVADFTGSDMRDFL
jgi:hypothetical protein